MSLKGGTLYGELDPPPAPENIQKKNPPPQPEHEPVSTLGRAVLASSNHKLTQLQRKWSVWVESQFRFPSHLLISLRQRNSC